MVGALWTVIGTFRFLTDNPSGVLVDRIGRKPIILIGSAIIIFSYVLFATAQDLNQLFVSSAVAAIGFVISTMGTRVYAADITPIGKEGSYMGIYTGMMMAGNIVGPTIGTSIAQFYGVRAPFIASTIISVIAIILSFLKVKEIGRDESDVGTRRSTLQGYVSILKNKIILILIVTSLLVGLAEMEFQNIVLPIYGVEVIHMSMVEVGIVTSIGSLTNIAARFLIVALLEGRLSRRIIILAGFLIRGIIIFSIVYATDFSSLSVIIAVSWMGFGVAQSFVEAVWLDLTTIEDGGRVFGVRISFQDAAMALGPIIITLLMGISLQVPLYILTLTAIVQSLIFFVILTPSIFEKAVQRTHKQ